MTKTQLAQMLKKITAGQTLFTMVDREWMVIGPAADLTPGAIVTATRKAGDTTEIEILSIYSTTSMKGGFAYVVAKFRSVTPKPAPVRRPAPVAPEAAIVVDDDEPAMMPAPRRDSYRVVRGGMFGPGRRYYDQPGATQYDDGSGTYSVQIWDNS